VQVVDANGVVVLLCALTLALVALRRRRLVAAHGAIEAALRRNPRPGGGGWSMGVLRYAGDQLEWSRVLSLSPRPTVVFSRADLVVVGRRTALPVEHMAATVGGAVVDLAIDDAVIELAMTQAALPGLLAWLEAGPPRAPRALAG
jgi:hypothetical protein